MKYLLIGDMHTKLDNIEESRRLIEFIVKNCKETEATPIFLGDQYDGMAAIRAEVLEFWVWAYSYINNALTGDDSKVSSISLTGNHDLNSDCSASAMSAHEKQTVVASGFGYLPLEGGIAAFGYIRDNSAFIAQAQDAYSKGFRTILCHAEFDGAQYDNGFYSPHGIDLNLCPPVVFISGHIHKRQWVKANNCEVRYIGTPRMLTRSDIGEAKGLVLWDTTKDEFKSIPTPSEVAVPFQQITIASEEELNLYAVAASSRTYVDIKGSSEFIKKALKKMPDSVKVRTFPDQDRAPVEIKESDGIPAAFRAYAGKYFSTKTLTEDAQKNVLNLVYEKCPTLRGNNG